jgi:methyltransferase (TIGR00027 family)
MKANTKAGRTAYGAALMKATEAFLPAPQRLFDDKIVADFLPRMYRFLLRRTPVRRAFVSLLDAQAPGIRGAVLCRTRRIDDAIGDAVSAGLRTLVILGAGLDTRPYRLPSFPPLRAFEIDLPSVQEFKKAKLRQEFGALPGHVRFVSADLNLQRIDDVLESGGLSGTEPAIFVWEGVSQYLPPQAVDSVLRAIAKRPAGTILVFTYLVEEAITAVYGSNRSAAFRKAAGRRPEPWYFGIDPVQLKAFLADRGLTLLKDFGAEEHQADLLRPIGRALEVSEIERVAIAAAREPVAP